MRRRTDLAGGGAWRSARRKALNKAPALEVEHVLCGDNPIRVRVLATVDITEDGRRGPLAIRCEFGVDEIRESR